MPELNNTTLPKSINEALKILAYNEFFYEDRIKSHINPHAKDRETIKSLAEAQYPWTEKQAKLAVIILKRYLTKFQKHKLDIKSLLDNPIYDEPFRVIDFVKSIEKYIDEKEMPMIDLKFPYTKKIITLVRCLKDKKGLPAGLTKYNGESKVWSFQQTDLTTYYLTLIAVRYDFKFVDTSLLDDYDKVKAEIENYKQPSARLIAGEIVLDNVSESLQQYWDKNLKDKDRLLQIDSLKHLQVDRAGITVNTKTKVGGKIAHHYYHKLWVNKKEYTRDEVIAGLNELRCFPIIMPVSGEVNTVEDINEYWDWLKAFERNGINILKQCSFGFDIKEPIRKEDIKGNAFDSIWDNSNIVRKMDNNNFGKLFELHQMSKQFKYIDETTKIIFVRNRIPRTLIKSKIKPGAAIVTLGGGYFSAGTDTLKRLLDNLPKKLYYSDSQPSSFDWNDNAIIKL